MLNARWQLETIQSAEPDGYGTWRWSYDAASYIPVAKAMEQAGRAGYKTLACGGFSVGCDMLLRAVLLTPARCDLLILQSPWIPILEDHGEALAKALKEKDITLKILCGECDQDCLPLAKQLYALTRGAGVPTELVVQAGSRHQFPEKPFPLKDF